MSFQAYLDNIKAKTGKTPEEFKKLAEKEGLLQPGVKNGEIVQWLKSEFQLGHGHAMAIAGVLMRSGSPKPTVRERFDRLFAGSKSSWKEPCEELVRQVLAFGPDVAAQANERYVNLLRGARKFGIIQPSAADRLDVGLKLKGVAPQGRLEASGSWNAMVTHRIKINKPSQLDADLLSWLREAYDAIPKAKALS